MAKVGNEAKLILSLAKERMSRLKDSRIQTPSREYCAGYSRAYDDWVFTLDNNCP
jgi:hypothetical protein